MAGIGVQNWGKSGVGNAPAASKEAFGWDKYGHYEYMSKPASESSSFSGAGDNAQWSTSRTPAQFAVTDLGRSADERRIYLISKGMSDIPSYLQWKETIGKEDFKYALETPTGYSTAYRNDVYAYHEWLDNKFGADNFSRQRDGSVAVNAATSTDPAVQEARKAATSRDTGGTEAPAEGSVAAPRRGRRGATLASLESSVNKPSILGG